MAQVPVLLRSAWPLLLFVSAAISASAQQPPSFDAKEKALGAQMAGDLDNRVRLLNDPAVQQYIESLATRLMPDAAPGFRFRLMADDPCKYAHEPASLPGGYIYVPASLFLQTGTEAEFAGMLAHAMEHPLQRHGHRAGQLSGAAIPVTFIGGWAGYCSGENAMPRGFLAAQRTDELEADRLAAAVLANAGIDPSQLEAYLARNSVDHERLGALAAVTAQLPKRDYIESTSRYAEMRERIISLP